MLFLEHDFLSVEHGHLQHFLYKEAETLGLIIHNGAEMLHHSGRLVDTLVTHHLRSKGNAGNGCLEFVGHVVDKVVLDFGITFLSENGEDGEKECQQKDDRENNGGNHETYTGKDVAVHVREMHLDYTHLVLRVITEEYLRIGVLFAVLGIV